MAPFAYRILIEWVERESQAAANVPHLAAGWQHRPLFTIILLYSDEDHEGWLGRATRSVKKQCYGNWELLLVGNGSVKTDTADSRIRILTSVTNGVDWAKYLSLALDSASGDYVVPLRSGTLLSPLALFRFAEALQTTPEARVLYGDQDSMLHGNRSDPWLKPDWNEEMFLGLDFVSRACAMATGSVRVALTQSSTSMACPLYALLLALSRNGGLEPVHVRHIIAHVEMGSERDEAPARARVIAAQFAENGVQADAGPFDTVTVRWPMPDPQPSVTILVPTRDKVELLKTCIDSLLAKTRYENYAVVIIDNASAEGGTFKYFNEISQDVRVSVLPCAMPYNFSAINNFAVDQTTGDYICFLNNDTEIVDGNWLGELMRYAVRSGIGAVGGKLLYDDRSIQHAGVVLGLGNAAGHAHRALAQGDPGYFSQAHVAQYVSAVTAACMVIQREKFLDVGGFDAEHLQIAYNDVDLCMKLGQAGWRNVYAPQAVMLHLETKSRGYDLSVIHFERYMRELAVLRERWNTETIVDPMHHPLLDRGSETYRIGF